MAPNSGGIQSVNPVFHDLLAVDVASAVVSFGALAGYTVTTPDVDPGCVVGIELAWFHVLSPLNSKGDAMASLGAALLALVSVFVAP